MIPRSKGINSSVTIIEYVSKMYKKNNKCNFCKYYCDITNGELSFLETVSTMWIIRDFLKTSTQITPFDYKKHIKQQLSSLYHIKHIPRCKLHKSTYLGCRDFGIDYLAKLHKNLPLFLLCNNKVMIVDINLYIF